MDNYILARDRARDTFLSYDLQKMLRRPGVGEEGENLSFIFLGTSVSVNRKSGVVLCSYPGGEAWEGDYAEAMSVYDWLCDGKENAVPAGEYCPLNSLPGIYVGGSGGLTIGSHTVTEKADKDPEKFRKACSILGGEECPAGDIGYKIPLFPNLWAVLKFYHSDEDFPAQLTVLWDKSTLDFVRYETVYYIAGVLFRRLLAWMA